MKRIACFLLALPLLMMTGCGGTASKKDEKPIVVMGAMECEIQRIMDALEDPKEVRLADYRAVEGTLDGHPVVAVRCLIGQVNSATAATLAIEKYDPRCVILQGTAGGHDPERHRGDIVLGDPVIDAGAYNSPHRDAGEGSDFTQWEYPGEEFYEGDEIVRHRELSSDETLLQIAEAVPYEGGDVVRGGVGTGDIWNKELDKINFNHEALGTDCEEMEGFAVAQVCKHLSVPYLCIRVISNSELYPDEEFDEAFALSCQDYAMDVIKAIAQDAKK